MTPLEQAIHDLLAGDSTVNTTTGGRIRPMVGAQLDARPFLTFSVVGGEDMGHATGNGAYSKATVEIGIYGDTYLQCAGMSEAVKLVLNRVARTTATARIAPSVFDDQSDIEQTNAPGQAAPVFVRTQTYRVCWRSLS